MTSSDIDPDHLAIRQTALDYWEGWFEGNAERMARSLHPGLAKRTIKHDLETGEAYLLDLTREIMVSATQDGAGAKTLPDQRQVSLAILDQYETIACVRCESPQWVEYLSLAKVKGRWVILNSLYVESLAVPSA